MRSGGYALNLIIIAIHLHISLLLYRDTKIFVQGILRKSKTQKNWQERYFLLLKKTGVSQYCMVYFRQDDIYPADMIELTGSAVAHCEDRRMIIISVPPPAQRNSLQGSGQIIDNGGDGVESSLVTRRSSSKWMAKKYNMDQTEGQVWLLEYSIEQKARFIEKIKKCVEFSECVNRGWLLKRSNHQRRRSSLKKMIKLKTVPWDRRYCILLDNGDLLYFKSNDLQDLRGRISLKTSLSLKATSDEETGKPFVEILDSDSKLYAFQYGGEDKNARQMLTESVQVNLWFDNFLKHVPNSSTLRDKLDSSQKDADAHVPDIKSEERALPPLPQSSGEIPRTVAEDYEKSDIESGDSISDSSEENDDSSDSSDDDDFNANKYIVHLEKCVGKDSFKEFKSDSRDFRHGEISPAAYCKKFIKRFKHHTEKLFPGLLRLLRFTNVSKKLQSALCDAYNEEVRKARAKKKEKQNRESKKDKPSAKKSSRKDEGGASRITSSDANQNPPKNKTQNSKSSIGPTQFRVNLDEIINAKKKKRHKTKSMQGERGNATVAKDNEAKDGTHSNRRKSNSMPVSSNKNASSYSQSTCKPQYVGKSTNDAKNIEKKDEACAGRHKKHETAAYKEKNDCDEIDDEEAAKLRKEVEDATREITKLKEKNEAKRLVLELLDEWRKEKNIFEMLQTIGEIMPQAKELGYAPPKLISNAKELKKTYFKFLTKCHPDKQGPNVKIGAKYLAENLTRIVREAYNKAKSNLESTKIKI